MNNSPCRNHITHEDCPDRKAGCSVTCEKWKAYVSERGLRYQESLREKIGAADYFDVRRVRSEMYRKHRLRKPKRINNCNKEENIMSETKSEYELSHNGENYPDPTPYRAIKNIEQEEEIALSEWEFHRKLIGCILRICELAGFSVENRIILKDKKTGKIWE